MTGNSVPHKITSSGKIQIDWNDDMVSRLRQVCVRDELSTAAMAAELGISKNALVRKAGSLDLINRPSPIKKTGAAKKPQRKASNLPVLESLDAASFQFPDAVTETAISSEAEVLYRNMRAVIDRNASIPAFMERPVRNFLETLAVRTTNIATNPRDLPEPVRNAVVHSVKQVALAIKKGSNIGAYNLPEIPHVLSTAIAVRGAQVT